jgi:DNA replication protein DnaC
MKTRTNISGENTDTSFDDEKHVEPKGDKNCLICKGAGFVHPRSDSGRPDFSRVVPCQCVRIAVEKEQENRLFKYSNLGALANQNFENINQSGLSGDISKRELFTKAFEAAKLFAVDPKGWFVLVGPSGSGKTYLAAAIANERIKLGQPAFFQTVPEFLDHLRSAFAPGSEMPYDELFNKVCNTPLLILDDLGVQNSTPWAKEKLDQLLNHRYIHELPTVITMSTSLQELDERVRTRLSNPRLSRIYVIEEKSPAIQLYSWDKEHELQKGMTFKSFTKRLNLPADQRQNLDAAFDFALDYAKSPEGGWLILQGVNGCGKTHLAAAIVNYRYEAKEQALFIGAPEFLDHLRKTYNPESKISYDQIFEEIKNVQLLVLDDYGEQSATPWAQEKLYQVINHRYNARLATIITTTSSLDEIESRVSSRMADQRISTVFIITAPDYRGDKSANPHTVKKNLRPLKKTRWNQET